MEFWGVEVKPGKPFAVVPDGDKILHLSQATLGEVKKDKANESVTIFVNIGEQKLVLGILSPEKFPQLSFDLVFEKEFELSHNCKNGSVYFCGYQTYGPEEGFLVSTDEFSDLESDEEKEVLPQVNGKLVSEAAKVEAPIPKASTAKPEPSKKQKVKLVDPSKDSEDDDESDEDDDESGEDDSDDESDEDMLAASDDDGSDEEEEDEETPKKAEVGKKRVNDSATKTPVPSKKAKSETPQKSDGKKIVHVATPYPNKNAGKTPISTKSKTQSPKSSGQFSCEPCKKSFNSDKGLESHNKAKHAAK